jgi:hypothetical protein
VQGQGEIGEGVYHLGPLVGRPVFGGRPPWYCGRDQPSAVVGGAVFDNFGGGNSGLGEPAQPFGLGGQVIPSVEMSSRARYLHIQVAGSSQPVNQRTGAASADRTPLVARVSSSKCLNLLLGHSSILRSAAPSSHAVPGRAAEGTLRGGYGGLSGQERSIYASAAPLPSETTVRLKEGAFGEASTLPHCER